MDAKVLRIAPGGAISAIIDSTGDGAGNPLANAMALAPDASGNVFVAGGGSNNAFRVEPGGTITVILHDGMGPIFLTTGIAARDDGTAFVSSLITRRIHRVGPDGRVKIVLKDGDGGIALPSPNSLALDAGGALYAVTGASTVVRLGPPEVPALPPWALVLTVAALLHPVRRAPSR